MPEASDLARRDVAGEGSDPAAPGAGATRSSALAQRGIYLIAVVAPIATLALRLLADRWMQARPALVWFFVPIILIAYKGGLGPGLLATGVSAVATKYFLARPAHTFGFPQVVDFIQWTIFVANGVMVSGLSERLRRARGRAETMLEHLSRTQAILHEGEDRLRIANEVAGIGTYDADLASGRVHFSPEMHAMLGIPAVRLTSVERAFDLVLREDRERVGRLLAEADDPNGAGMARAELRVMRPDGEIRSLSWSGRTFFRRGPDGARPIRRVGACVDVTELRRAERRLATQHAVSRVLADASTLREATPLIMQAMCDSEGWDFGAIWQLDPSGARLQCSETWSRPGLDLDGLRRATEGLSLAIGDGLPGRVWQARGALLWRDVSTEMYARSPAAVEVGLRSALGFPILVGERITGVIDFLGRRIPSTDPRMLETFDAIGRQLGAFFERKAAEAHRQQLEVQLRQAQKMEAIGQLSGGIAHDFNNILTAIGANLHLAEEDIGPHHVATPSLRDAARATDRAADLVRQILLFARRRPIERRPIDLRTVGEQSVRLLRATLPAGVEVRFWPADDVPAISADATQMQQVIMNLGTNAWHALIPGNGHIDITIEAVDLDAEAARRAPGRRPGRWVRLAVRDTGVGMDAATLERIFEPFFTTKGPDRGTGLGLAVVHGIVAGHDGSIAVTSCPGGGTTFEVYLPPASEPSEPRAAEVVQAAHGAGEHVLFIDDEPMLNRSATRGLERSGYRVSAYGDPRQGLEALRRRPDDFALVITDMNMPNLSGLEVARAVRERRPDLPILLLSGNLDEEVRAQAAQVGVNHVIQKPWTFEDLAEAVKRLLGERPPAPGGAK